MKPNIVSYNHNHTQFVPGNSNIKRDFSPFSKYKNKGSPESQCLLHSP